MVLGTVSVALAQDGWTPYTDDQLGGGTVQEDARDAGPLPEGCAGPEAKDHYVIGMSQANRAEPWREAMDSQIAAAADGYPEFEVVFQDAAQDNADQVSDVENLLTQGIDLLIISPNEAAPLNDAVKAAWDACVPVIVLDRNLVDPNYSMFIGADNVAIGQAAGEYAAEWCADNGRTACKVAEIRGLEGAPPAKDRGDGFRAGLVDRWPVRGQHRLLAERRLAAREGRPAGGRGLPGDTPTWTSSTATTTPWPRVPTSPRRTPASTPRKVLFIGIDALPDPDGGIMSVLEGRLGVTFVYPTGGKQAIDWAQNILVGRREPAAVAGPALRHGLPGERAGGLQHVRLPGGAVAHNADQRRLTDGAPAQAGAPSVRADAEVPTLHLC